MLKGIYAVYDSKAKVFGNPFFGINDSVAVRSFSTAAKDPQSEISKFPEDFTLFLLGSFDDESGVIVLLPQMKNLGLASMWRKPVADGDQRALPGV